MSDNLTASLRSFQTTLSPQERSELSTMERAAMNAETRDLLLKARQNKGGAMGTTKQAQATPPPVGAPLTGPTPKAGQDAPMPRAPIPPEAKVSQAPVAPPVEPPPVMAQTDPLTEAPPDAGGIEGYIDEIEETPDEMSSAEMGIEDPSRAASRAKVAAYVEAYGHLRIRPTVKNALEVYDPKTNQNLVLIRPNKTTRKDAKRLRRCAVEVLASIAHVGLVKTAQMWKGQIKRADGVVDYGTAAQTEKPDSTDNSINDRGETNMQRDITIGVDSTTGEGDNLAAEEKPETREPAGLSGKAAAADVPENGGILPGHDTNMSDGPAKSSEGNALSSLKDNESDKQTEPSEKNKGDSSLDDEINTFANESLTAGLRQAQADMTGEPPMPMDQTGGCAAQMEPPPGPGAGAPGAMPPVEGQGMPGTPPPPPAAMPQAAQPDPTMPVDPMMDDPSMMDPEMDAAAPGMGADVLPGEEDVTTMTDEQKIARLYRKRAEKQVAINTRNFVARFVRCVRVAARRQALNLEPNQLKIAVADALMSEAQLSQHETYVPMDSRCATFVIERGLDQRNAMAFVDSLIKRSAAFMKMSDEALTQVEEDLEAIQPVAPGMEMDAPVDPGMELDPMDPGMEMEGQPTDPVAPSVMPTMPQMAQEPPPCEQCGGVGCEVCMDESGEMVDPGVGGAPDDMQFDDVMTETEEQRAASVRNRAASGNLPINPGAAAPPAVGNRTASKRDQIRFAVGATKNAALHKHFGGNQ